MRQKKNTGDNKESVLSSFCQPFLLSRLKKPSGSSSSSSLPHTCSILARIAGCRMSARSGSAVQSSNTDVCVFLFNYFFVIIFSSQPQSMSALPTLSHSFPPSFYSCSVILSEFDFSRLRFVSERTASGFFFFLSLYRRLLFSSTD